MGNPIPFERVMAPNRHIKENYGDLQPIAPSMKPTLWVPSENFSFNSSLIKWQVVSQQTIMQEIAKQKRCDFYVVIMMILCHPNFSAW